ncbi:putative F-box protein At5g55150 [Silene latifolia]|uniref:putative F-box protein At5g55150 n=1 Tax=Silene latifolia TaxID=37657 RepID=UPI003D77962A
MGNWSELDYDLLGEIVLKLDAIQDFVHFSVVCRSWNRASSLVKSKWKPSMPCLLLAENHTENPAFLRKILSLDNDKCYQLSLPHTFGARCWGSNCGWVVTIDLSRQIYMYNPFTKARLGLPPQPTLPNQDPPLDNEEEDAILTRMVSIRKAIVVKDGNDLIVLAMHSNWKRFLSFARPGDVTWTPIVPPWPVEGTPAILPFSQRTADVVCKDGSILILYEDASVGGLDLSDLSKSRKSEHFVKAKQFLPSSEVFKNRLNKHLQEMYFVESLGKLLIVLRHKRNVWDPDSQVNEDEIYKTDRFEVFAFDSEARKWEQVTELGDVALFVGDNQSISVRASDCRNCKSNCIYFTDDCDEFWNLPPKFGGHDIGFFDLADGKFHQFYGGDDVNSDFCTPFWFMPHF